MTYKKDLKHILTTYVYVSCIYFFVLNMTAADWAELKL